MAKKTPKLSKRVPSREAVAARDAKRAARQALLPRCPGTWARPVCELPLDRRARAGVCPTCWSACTRKLAELRPVWKRLGRMFGVIGKAVVTERLAQAMLARYKRIYRFGRHWAIDEYDSTSVSRKALYMLASEDAAKLLGRAPLCIIRDNRVAELLEPIA